MIGHFVQGNTFRRKWLRRCLPALFAAATDKKKRSSTRNPDPIPTQTPISTRHLCRTALRARADIISVMPEIRSCFQCSALFSNISPNS
jgi:hypothetical protein